MKALSIIRRKAREAFGAASHALSSWGGERARGDFDDFESRQEENLSIDLEKDPATQRMLSAATGFFTPMVEKLNGRIPEDAENRTFRLVVTATRDTLTFAPEIEVSVAYINAIEEKAWRFYLSEEGGQSSYFRGGDPTEASREDLAWGVISNRVFNVAMPVHPSLNKAVFFGLMGDGNGPAFATENISDFVDGLYSKLFGKNYSVFFGQNHFSGPREMESFLLSDLKLPKASQTARLSAPPPVSGRT